MKRSIRMAMAALCVLGSTVVHAETITALSIQDTSFWDWPANAMNHQNLGNGPWSFMSAPGGSLFIGQGGVGQWTEYGGEVATAIIFEQDKLQGLDADQIAKATFRMELRRLSGSGDEGQETLENMGWDIIALKSEWKEMEATWNAQQQDCSLLFGIIFSCTEDEIVDWIPDNGIDDGANAIFGPPIYGGSTALHPAMDIRFPASERSRSGT